MKKYKTAKTAKRPVIEFDLDGVVFKFTAPKQAGMALAFLTGGTTNERQTNAAAEMFNWLSDGLSETQNDILIGRLKDPKDSLEFETLMEIVNDLMAEASARPTSPQ